MRVRRKTATAVLWAILLGPLTANAATVSKQIGAVLVNSGNGFISITSETEVAPGNQIMVPPGGLATITYASNCAVRIGSGVWWVQAAAPCANGATVIDFTGRMNQEALPTPPPGIPPLVLGVVIVGGAIAIGVLANHADKPASP